MPSSFVSKEIRQHLSLITGLSSPSSKTPLPAYQSTSLVLSDGLLKLRCDGQNGFGEVSVKANGEPFNRVFVNTQKLSGAINAIGDNFELSASSNGILLQGSSSKIELRSIDCEHQANITEDVSEWHPVDGKAIAKAIRKTYGLFDDATAVTLGKEGAVYCTANGSRFAWTTGLSIPFKVAITTESVKMFASFIENGDVQIGQTNGLCVARFSSQDVSGAFAARKMEYGKLAPYSYQVTQKPKTHIASVLKMDLINALRACSVVESADNTEVEIVLRNNQMTLKKRATDYGRSGAVVNLQNFVEGTDFVQPHDGQRLLKVLSSCFSDEISIDICTMQANDIEILAFYSGNSVGISAPLEKSGQ